MKLAIRIIALTIVVAGAAAAATTPKTTPFVSHQSATGPLPRPDNTLLPLPWCCNVR